MTTADLLAPPRLPAASKLVKEHSTGLQLTTVHRAPDGSFLWWHRPGAGRRSPVAAPAAGLAPVHMASGAACLALPAVVGDGLLHRAHGPRSAASWLGDPRPGASALVADALASAGRSLRALHEVSLPPLAPLGRPPGVVRLRSWLTGTIRSAAAAQLLTHLRSSWGRRRINTVLDWSLRLRDVGPEDAGPCRLLHGGASLGALVPPLSRGRPVALLTGEDLSAGDPEADLGWLVGELAEMRWNAGRTGLDQLVPHDHTALQRVLLDAYGPDHDSPTVARAAVLRIVTHLHDFAAYVNWTDELIAYSAFAAELIDSEGAHALPGAAR